MKRKCKNLDKIIYYPMIRRNRLIMEALWDAQRPLTVRELYAVLPSEKEMGIKPGTLPGHLYLSEDDGCFRLSHRLFRRRENWLVTPCLSREEYKALAARKGW